MKTFRFWTEWYIEAENEDEAKEIFANTSWDFAAAAEVEEVDPDTRAPRG